MLNFYLWVKRNSRLRNDFVLMKYLALSKTIKNRNTLFFRFF